MVLSMPQHFMFASHRRRLVSSEWLPCSDDTIANDDECTETGINDYLDTAGAVNLDACWSGRAFAASRSDTD
jgi:hypothetical protein